MTQAVARLLKEMEQLSSSEQTDLRRALNERASMSEDDLTDEELTASAARMFALLDEEEFAHDARRLRPGS